MLACSGSSAKTPGRKGFVETDAGPPPTVDMDAGVPVATAQYLAAKSRARAFAAGFTWSSTPTLEQAPTQPGLFGGIGSAPFAIAKLEIWVKKGEFTLRATSGGVDHCLGPELVVRGALETKTFTSPLEPGRGYFQVPRGGAETDAVRFVETTTYVAPTASVLEITKLERRADGEPVKASGRFVVVMEPRSPYSRMWAAGSFVDAPVTAFVP